MKYFSHAIGAATLQRLRCSTLRASLRCLGVLLFIASLVACTTAPATKGSQSAHVKKDPLSSQVIVNVPTAEKDSGPPQAVDVSNVPDAVPRPEPRTAAGNKSPYTVLGKSYSVMQDSNGFTQRGIASWYGKKFHGMRTSNGEIYNMYSMTAAHKTLPIPTFVQVTNLDNGKQVIVRVNDRGPFHQDRVIDLSYAAAQKLGYDTKGTARVEVVAIDPVAYQLAQAKSQPAATTPAASVESPAAGYDLPANTFLQAGAFGAQEAANALIQKLRNLTHYPVFVESSVSAAKKVFRVRIGPIRDNFELVSLRELIMQHNLGVPHVVNE